VQQGAFLGQVQQRVHSRDQDKSPHVCLGPRLCTHELMLGCVPWAGFGCLVRSCRCTSHLTTHAMECSVPGVGSLHACWGTCSAWHWLRARLLWHAQCTEMAVSMHAVGWQDGERHLVVCTNHPCHSLAPSARKAVLLKTVANPMPSTLPPRVALPISSTTRSCA